MIKFLVTGLYSGLIKPASGTWGTLSVLPFAYAVSYFLGFGGLVAFAIILGIAGTYLTKLYLDKTQKDDPSEVVIDEWCGMVIALLPVAQFSFLYWGLAFVLFRLFDIVKVGPVGYCDKKIKGSVGVMLDDIVAGILATIPLILITNYF